MAEGAVDRTGAGAQTQFGMKTVAIRAPGADSHPIDARIRYAFPAEVDPTLLTQ